MQQRPAKKYRASIPGEGNITVARLMEFSRNAQDLLIEHGETEAAHYFEQLADHLQRYPEKGLNEKVSRILGV